MVRESVCGSSTTIPACSGVSIVSYRNLVVVFNPAPENRKMVQHWVRFHNRFSKYSTEQRELQRDDFEFSIWLLLLNQIFTFHFTLRLSDWFCSPIFS